MNTEEKLLKLTKLADAMYYAAQYLTTDASRLHKAMDEYRKFIIHECKEESVSEQKLSNVQRTVKDGKEPVSEGLEEASKEWLRPQLDKSYANYGEVKMMELTHFDGYAMIDAIEFGAQWQKEQFKKECTDLCNGIATAKGIAVAMAYDKGIADAREQMMKNVWKPADGDDLPEIDREVIALIDNGMVVFAHRPDPKGWDAKSIITEKVEHYTPYTYGKGGWNQPNVKWWMKLPKMDKEECEDEKENATGQYLDAGKVSAEDILNASKRMSEIVKGI